MVVPIMLANSTWPGVFCRVISSNLVEADLQFGLFVEYAPSQAMSSHEPVHDEEVVGPSDRSFGVVFTVVFSLVGLLPLWRGAAPRWWAVGVALVFGLLALFGPRGLAPANRVWLRIGLLLHRIVNPVVMGVVFYLVVTPFGYVVRLGGKGFF